jgi:methionyl-tRNA formyltransferase
LLPPPRLRVALFASSSNFGARALEELAAAHEVVAIVRPARPGVGIALRRATGLAEPAPLESRALALGVPVVTASGAGEQLAQRLGALRTELICVALYPRLVPAAVASAVRLGAINAHPSLLPRHRGPLPLFWTYHADDRVAGVSIHHASERLDGGDVILQESFDLPRGYPVDRLDRDLAARAARMLREAADALARGTATRTPQDETRATLAPIVKRGSPMIPLDEWDAERTWHFLAGLCPQYREPLVDDHGRPVHYTRVLAWRPGSSAQPVGRVERSGDRLLLRLRDGVVELA